MSVFFLPYDLTNIVLQYVYEISPDELEEDLNFYIRWRTTVPPMFLSATLFDTRYYFNVANPMLRYHPYTPRKHLRMRPCDIWSSALSVLVRGLCKEQIRELGTYRGCAIRWCLDCVQNRKVFYYTVLQNKILTKLKSHHFRRCVHPCFVLHALLQISLFAAS